MLTLTDFTSADEVRTLLGLTVYELEDSQVESDLCAMHLTRELQAVAPDHPLGARMPVVRCPEERVARVGVQPRARRYRLAAGRMLGRRRGRGRGDRRRGRRRSLRGISGVWVHPRQ